MTTRIEINTTGVTEVIARMNARIARFVSMEPEMLAASEIVYEATASWMESNGEGSWPPLAASTVARKVAQGMADPSRPLYAHGNLFESATQPNGPYSFRHPAAGNDMVMGVDWQEGGWQIPIILAGGNEKIPPRPIWPPRTSMTYLAMRAEITALMLKGI